MAKTIEKHIHKLKRLKYKTGNAVFFCTLPDCTFKINTSLALGKRSICWRCGQDFILDEYTLRLSKPHCPDCHQPKIKPAENHDDTSMTETENRIDQVVETIRQNPFNTTMTLAERLNKISGTEESLSEIVEDEGEI